MPLVSQLEPVNWISVLIIVFDRCQNVLARGRYFEAAVRAVLAEAAERSLRGMTAALQPTNGGPVGESSGLRDGGSYGQTPRGGDGDNNIGEELEPLDLDSAAAVERELLSGEGWANAVMALRRGQEDILEHVLRESR